MGADPTVPVAEEAGRREPPRCYFCRRDTSDGLYRNVDVRLGEVGRMEARVVRVCDICWEKRDEDPVEIPMDMTEDDDAG